MIRTFGFTFTAALVLLLTAQPSPAQIQPSDEWPVYGRDKSNTKYSTLDQINRTNAKQLQVAWRWQSPDAAVAKANPRLRAWHYEATPLMIRGVLYVSTSFSQVAAIEATTGKTLWTHDPKSYEAGTPANLGFVSRGLAYWNDGESARVFIGTGDAHLIALDAKSGQPIAEFGKDGRIDLTQGLSRPVDRKLYSVTSPPLICRDVVIVGSSVLDFPVKKEMPPGDVRAFDVRTGKLKWTFRSVPQEGEFGNDTWEDGSWKHTGAANVWTIMSADDELGYVYLPLSTPANDFYGGHRPGNNLFGESLVCVEAATGKRIWHFQMVHHGLWDYDLPAAPNLVDIQVNDKKIKAVAQVSKQGFCYVFDRVTGQSIWPIEEKPVPQSKIPGEKSSLTQPFPTKPAPFDRQGAKEEDLIDWTPELRAEALKIFQKYDSGPLYTPPTEKGTIYLPGWAGGANWAGAVADPETGMLYVPSITNPITVTLAKPFTLISDAKYVGSPGFLSGPRGLPLFKPPFGRITAIDLNTGEHAWMVPLGDGPRDHPALKDLKLPRLGWPRRGQLLITKTLLFAAQEGSMTRNRPSDAATTKVGDIVIDQPKFMAFDKANGELLAEIVIPSNVNGAPMTYRVGGKQYIVMPVGGSNLPAELVALCLP